jgi:general secretion pathway protein N
MKIKLILLFVLFYLGALIATLPADKIVSFIPEDSGIQVVSASGSLWDGKAAQLTYKKQLQLQQRDWQFAGC